MRNVCCMLRLSALLRGASVVASIFTVASAHGGIPLPFAEEAAIRGVVYTIQPFVGGYDGYLGYGCAIVDLDDDGDQDLVILGKEDGTVGLFENNGAGQFTDRSAISGIPALAEASGSAIADYDGDGRLDIYLTNYGLPHVLARNLGGLQFSNTAVAAGVTNPLGPGKGAAFGDYDGDGWLDLYVCNNDAAELALPDENRLYHNLGNGTFAEVGAALGVDDPGNGFEAVWFDYDLDGDVDLYLSNDRWVVTAIPNRLWRNDGGDLVSVPAAGANVGLFSMGVACGDFDGNGWPDLYCTNIADSGGDNVGGVFPLLLNQGNGTFVESALNAGVDFLDGPNQTGWGAIFFDYDNDTHLDLYVNVQHPGDPNRFFDNPGTFPPDLPNIAAAMQVTANAGSSFSSAAGDIDGDGDLDLLVNNLGDSARLFINQSEEANNWIRYRMVGLGPNGHAIGGRTHTRTGTQWQLREILAGGNSYLGQNELVMHLGLSSALTVDELTAVWPGGLTQRTLTSLPANQTWTLYPPQRLGDSDGDGDVELEDFSTFVDCYEIPFAPGCEIMDFDGDSDVDSDDFDAFLAALRGTPDDCNENAQIDLQEILNDRSIDMNSNGVIDACEPPCISFTSCADADEDGIRDDPCMWWACEAGACAGTPRDAGQADIGGFAGACLIDGACDINDKFHAQNCFGNQDTTGAPGYPCEEDPPSALNADAVGFAGGCALDGVCDINDAFAAENCFANQNTGGNPPFPCSCPSPGPQPTAPRLRPVPAEPRMRPVPADAARLALRAAPDANPGDLIVVEVHLLDALKVLRGYQLHTAVSGGSRGTLELVDVSVRQQDDAYVFGGRAGDAWGAFNVHNGQMFHAVSPLGAPAAAGAYLATFTYRVSSDAAGTFAVDLLHDEVRATPTARSFLFAAPHEPIGIAGTEPAVIQVAGRSPAHRRGH